MATENVKTTAADMEEFKATPYYQGLGIEALEKELAGYQTGDAELRAQAEAQYRPTYESESEAIRQELERQVQGYEAEMAGMGAAYDRQRRRTNQAYDESAVDLNNQLTRRGLGRSSLVSTQGAYLENQRNQALGDIDREESGAIHAINEKIAMLTDQAAQSGRTLAGNYARQLENRISELKEQNRSASISLQLQIAALQQQGYEAYQDWLIQNRKQEIAEKEYEAEYGAQQAAAGGGSGTKKSASAGTAAKSVSATTKKTVESPTAKTVLSSMMAAFAQALAKKKKGSAGSTGSAAVRKGSADKRQTAME